MIRPESRGRHPLDVSAMRSGQRYRSRSPASVYFICELPDYVGQGQHRQRFDHTAFQTSVHVVDPV